MAKKVKASFLLKITGTDGVVNEYLVDLKEGSGSFTKGTGTWPFYRHLISLDCTQGRETLPLP